MGVNRNYVDKVADIVRNNLALQVPMTLDSLLAAVSGKLPGKCVPKSEQELKVDAQIITLGEESFEIHFLEDRPDTRKLFSISHELGHLFLHLLEKDGRLRTGAVCQRDMAQTRQEMEANEFAAALLMPEEEFVDKCREYRTGNRINLTKVAEYFHVSVQAATVRGNVIGLWQA